MANVEEDSDLKKVGRFAEGAIAGEAMQTRFQRIPAGHLSKETVAGVRDMKLGQIKNNKPIGAPTIRFDSGKNTGTSPHINIDSAGYSSKSNPHIQVSEGTVNAAKIVNKTLKYAGITLTVAAVAIDAWRIFSALKTDIYISKNADQIINELEDAIQKLQIQLRDENVLPRRRDIEDTIQHLQRVLKDVKLSQRKGVPVQYIKTVSSVAGGWGGGAAAGAGGAWAGAQTGAAVGLLFGPAGAAVGAPIGAIFGAISGGIAGGYAGSKAGEAAAYKILE